MRTNKVTIDLSQYLSQRKAWVDRALATFLPQPSIQPSLLHKAVHYSVFAGGKRLRPILMIAAYEATGGLSEDRKKLASRVLAVASAIEMLHTYSLVHDDLPAMDNDDYRRGKLTSHKMFGEHVAILVGDSLLTSAFTLLSDRRLNAAFTPGVMLQVIHELGEAAGSRGMVGGQLMDIQSRDQDVNEKTVRTIHSKKTGSLIRACVRVGGLLAGASSKALSALGKYGEKAGLAFQIIDDVLDVEGNQDLMGKRVRKDQEYRTATYPGVVGLRRAKRQAQMLLKEAISSLSVLNQRAVPLQELALYMGGRKR